MYKMSMSVKLLFYKSFMNVFMAITVFAVRTIYLSIHASISISLSLCSSSTFFEYWSIRFNIQRMLGMNIYLISILNQTFYTNTSFTITFLFHKVIKYSFSFLSVFACDLYVSACTTKESCLQDIFKSFTLWKDAQDR